MWTPTNYPDSCGLYTLESLSYLECNFWEKSQLHTNTDFSVTGWMLCVIPHIHKDAKDHSDSDHRKQVNNVIRTLFHGLSEDESSLTLHFFYIAYTDFDNNIGSFDEDEFIWKRERHQRW